MLQATGTAKMILEQTERMSQQVNSAIRGQQMSDTELDLTARAAEEVLSTVMRARMNRQTVHAGQQQGGMRPSHLHTAQQPMQQAQQSLPPLQQQSPVQQVPQSSHSLPQPQALHQQQQHPAMQQSPVQQLPQSSHSLPQYQAPPQQQQHPVDTHASRFIPQHNAAGCQQWPSLTASNQQVPQQRGQPQVQQGPSGTASTVHACVCTSRMHQDEHHNIYSTDSV
jgi:hypothetical protein